VRVMYCLAISSARQTIDIANPWSYRIMCRHGSATR
jgi:hypothetical protein